jgi:hypothetical protein
MGVFISHSLGIEPILDIICESPVVKLWYGEASWSLRGALRRGEEGALGMVGVDVSEERSSVMRVEDNIEWGWIGGELGSSAGRISSIMEERIRMSLWMACICFECCRAPVITC